MADGDAAECAGHLRVRQEAGMVRDGTGTSGTGFCALDGTWGT
ncbi:MAG TPA: hypothetical protein P5515_01650 [Methanolinea sp.]|nr:hypothetical protein [Methanolinea sp.]